MITVLNIIYIFVLIVLLIILLEAMRLTTKEKEIMFGIALLMTLIATIIAIIWDKILY